MPYTATLHRQDRLGTWETFCDRLLDRASLRVQVCKTLDGAMMRGENSEIRRRIDSPSSKSPVRSVLSPRSNGTKLNTERKIYDRLGHG